MTFDFASFRHRTDTAKSFFRLIPLSLIPRSERRSENHRNVWVERVAVRDDESGRLADLHGPIRGTFNTQRVRNLIYQPGFQNWNLGLFKRFPVNEHLRFQFRAEAYNVWNHPNWCGNSGCSGTTNIGLNPTNTATFGKVLSKGSGSSGQGERNLQISLRKSSNNL
jgi:hypothetical protein